MWSQLHYDDALKGLTLEQARRVVDLCSQLIRWREQEILEALKEDPSLTNPIQHPDDMVVDRFAAAMKAKLAKKRDEGRRGWDDPSTCTLEFLEVCLAHHVGKGDQVDVANFAMMIWTRRAMCDHEIGRWVDERGVCQNCGAQIDELVPAAVPVLQSPAPSEGPLDQPLPEFEFCKRREWCCLNVGHEGDCEVCDIPF